LIIKSETRGLTILPQCYLLDKLQPNRNLKKFRILRIPFTCFFEVLININKLHVINFKFFWFLQFLSEIYTFPEIQILEASTSANQGNIHRIHCLNCNKCWFLDQYIQVGNVYNTAFPYYSHRPTWLEKKKCLRWLTVKSPQLTKLYTEFYPSILNYMSHRRNFSLFHYLYTQLYCNTVLMAR